MSDPTRHADEMSIITRHARETVLRNKDRNHKSSEVIRKIERDLTELYSQPNCVFEKTRGARHIPNHM